MKSKFLKIFLFIVLAAAAAYVYISNNYQLTKKGTPKQTEQPVETTSTPVTTVEKGTVTGRLCYPSDFLPKGSIAAKNITSGEEFSQEYPGSFAGGGMTYSFDLPAGQYYLKYIAVPNPKSSTAISGYHTELCKTGRETSCAQENKRVNVAVTVTGGETTQNIDLCDFYYAQNDEPKF